MGPDCTHGDRSRRSSSVLCHVPNLHGRTTQKAVGCREGPTQTTAARFDVLYPRRWAENALRREEPMSACGGYRAEPLGGNRQMVAASAAVGRESNTIHLMTEVDITGPRRLITEHREHTGERLSLTGYVVACLARTLAEFPRFNSFRRGSRLIVLDDLTISVLFEREIDGENVPEPVGIQAANRKTHRQLNDKRGRRSSMRSSGSARRREPSGSGSSRASCLGASSGWRLATSACRSGSASSGRTTKCRGTRTVSRRRCRGSRPTWTGIGLRERASTVRLATVRPRRRAGIAACPRAARPLPAV